MQEHTGYRYRLYPSADQADALASWAGCARAVWNAALEQRHTAWRMRQQRVRWPAQDAELTEAKRAFPWLAEPHSDVLQQALRDLDRAFATFFRREARYPGFKRKGRDSFRIQSRPGKGEINVRRLNRRWGEVRVPKLGWVRFRFSRKPLGAIKHLTISRDALGWHVSLCCAREAETPPQHFGPPVGLDRGVAATAALSTGALYSCPGLGHGQAERLRRLMRKAGRQEAARRRRAAGKRRRSRRHQRTLDRVARLCAREARIRRDFLHRLSCGLAKSHGLIAIERLDVARMTASAKGTADQPGTGVAQKRGLNRAILAQGWGELRRQLVYKTAREGGRLVEAPAQLSSRTCAECSHVDEASREGRRFRCTACGHAAHADINAARVILARAVEGQEDGGRAWSSRHGEPSAMAWRRTVNHSEALAA